MHNQEAQHGPSLIERIDLALASRMVLGGGDPEPVATAQRVLDGVRSPTAGDAAFLASLLRLRGFVVYEDDAICAMERRDGRLPAISQEMRMLRGLHECLRSVRERAAAGTPPDGWFLVDAFRRMTSELPRFRNNELRRGTPWDAQLHVNYPAHGEVRELIDSFHAERRFRDVPQVFDSLHPVRQGFRILWRFARIAPFPDMNMPIAWLAMNAWLQAHGYPLIATEDCDQQLLARLIGSPPPTKIVQFESRLLAALEG